MLGWFRWLFGFDRRKYPRFSRPEGVKAICAYMESGKRIEFPAKIINISKGGARLFMGETKLFPKTPLEISVESSIGNKKATMNAIVLRTHRKYNESIYYSAVKFVKGYEDAIEAAIDHFR